MDEREALLRAILAAPDDDLPRLVFADWLEERQTSEDTIFAILLRARPVQGMATMTTPAVVDLVRRGCNGFQAARQSVERNDLLRHGYDELLAAERQVDTIMAAPGDEAVMRVARTATTEIVLGVVAQFQPLMAAALKDLARRAEAGDQNPDIRAVYHDVVRVADWPRQYGLPDLNDALAGYWRVVRDRVPTPGQYFDDAAEERQYGEIYAARRRR